MTSSILIWVAGAVGGALIQRLSELVFGEPLEKLFATLMSRQFFSFGSLSGTWEGRYTYLSDRDGQTHEDRHVFQLSKIGRRVVLIAKSGTSPRGMNSMRFSGTLSDRGILTGTWIEVTGDSRRYTGSAQLLLTPTGTEFRGQWVGYTKAGDIQTGPWVISKVTAPTNQGGASAAP